MDRRELLKMIAVITGGVMIGGDALLSGCHTEKGKSRGIFSQADVDFLNEVADTILPETKSPGAKAAKVGEFMTVMVNDCYEERDRKSFYEGISKLDEACNKMHGSGFMKVTPAQRLALLTKQDQEAKEYQSKKGELEEAERKKNKDFAGLSNHYFLMMKQLTLYGYFSSEIGATKAMRYMAVPGKYEGSVPYHKGDKAWA